MDEVKERLKNELESISFTEERKKEIVRNVKQRRKKKFNAPVWKYRAVLSAAILLAVGFALTSRNEPGGSPAAHQAAGGEWEAVLNLLAYDSVKTVLLALVFLMVYLLLKRNLKKQGRGMPACAQCGETWNRKLAFKKAMKNEKTDCPFCGTANYQTKKSRWKTSVFNLFMPFMILIGNAFSMSFYGIAVYLLFLVILAIRLIPYYVELQLDDPMKEPLW